MHSPVQGIECSSLLSCVNLALKNVKTFSGDLLLEYDFKEPCLEE